MKLFDKKDVLSWANCSEAKLSEEGYFGYSISDLEEDVKTKKPRRLCEKVEDSAYTFKAPTNGTWEWYPFFLPAYSVKKPPYRPLQDVDELLNFLAPDFDADDICDQAGNKVEIDTNKKTEILLGKKIVLKNKTNGRIKIMVIQDIEFSSDITDSSNTYLNCYSLEDLFSLYEIQKDDEFVPFGIEDW